MKKDIKYIAIWQHRLLIYLNTLFLKATNIYYPADKGELALRVSGKWIIPIVNARGREDS